MEFKEGDVVVWMTPEGDSLGIFTIVKRLGPEHDDSYGHWYETTDTTQWVPSSEIRKATKLERVLK